MIVQHTPYHLIVCIPKDYTDEQIEAWANEIKPTPNHWKMLQEGHKELMGLPARSPCGMAKELLVHVRLETT